MKALLGGKGANLAEMAKLGMPVPPGFTITTEGVQCVQRDAGAGHAVAGMAGTICSMRSITIMRGSPPNSKASGRWFR